MIRSCFQLLEADLELQEQSANIKFYNFHVKISGRTMKLITSRVGSESYVQHENIFNRCFSEMHLRLRKLRRLQWRPFRLMPYRNVFSNRTLVGKIAELQTLKFVECDKAHSLEKPIYDLFHSNVMKYLKNFIKWKDFYFSSDNPSCFFKKLLIIPLRIDWSEFLCNTIMFSYPYCVHYHETNIFIYSYVT